MARKKFVADFETTTDPQDCRVWAYGHMEIGNESNYTIGNDMDEFMHWCKTINSDVYFHNLKFDGSFIVSYLLNRGFEFDNSKYRKPNTFNVIISGMGQWYMIDICYGRKGKNIIHTVIYDSLKKLPFSVSQIGVDFKLGVLKGDLDYTMYRSVGHVITKAEEKYIYHDLVIVAKALEIQFKQGLTAMTTGSDSLKGFKRIIGDKAFRRLFPILSHQMDEQIRFAYRGGFTWLNERYAGKLLGEGIVFDVNSLYPSVMYNKLLPYGMPLFFGGEYQHDEDYPLYIQQVRFDFELKPEHIPTIQIKGSFGRFKDNEYLKSSRDEEHDEPVEMFVTSVDWALIQEHYDVEDVQFISGWKFQAKTNMFNDFIDYWTAVKTSKDSEPAQVILAKLMLNSLYGKFASNPNVTGKYPVLKPDGSLKFEMGEIEFKDPVYTAMGAFVTSWARDITIRTAQKCYDRIIYCDTDSIHLVGTEIPEAIQDVIHDKELGKWAFEGTFKEAKYIRQKTYYHVYYAKIIEKNGEDKVVQCPKEEATTELHSVKCAGMPKSVKKFVTLDNFKVGFKSGGKLVPRQVPGGVVLKDTEFTLK